LLVTHLSHELTMSIPTLRNGAALLCATLILAACSRPAPPEEPVRSVKIVTVASGQIGSSAEYSGEVRARVESRLGFRVAGKLVRRQAEPGQRVRAGDLLAQLDPQDYQLAADAARAQVSAAVTNRDLAAADFKRFKDLREQNFISSAELDRREASLKAAQAQLEQAQAQLAGQGNQAAYTRLLADVSGVVTAVEAEVGQVVAAGTPVLRIAQDGPRDVVFAVPEDKVLQMKTGTGVEVRGWSGGAPIQGVVREVAASADPVTRTFGVKVAIDSRSAPPLGSTVSVLPQALARDGTAVIKLPTSAFRQDGQTSAVWVLDSASMTVRLQPVKIATADGNEVVVAAGLQPGMQVVVAGVHVLSPGQKVTIYKEKQAIAPVFAASSAMPSVATTASAPAAAASK
jgi:RND family efflux transporter MFP subunit